MKTKEDWIDDTMESLDGIQRTEIDPIFLEKVLHRIQLQKPVVTSFFSPMVLRAAAMILLLISFNIVTFVYFPGKSDKHDKAVKSVASEYFFYIDSLNL